MNFRENHILINIWTSILYRKTELLHNTKKYNTISMHMSAKWFGILRNNLIIIKTI